MSAGETSRRSFRPWVIVHVAHDHFRSGRCEGLRFRPAPETAEALARRGVRFQDRGTGFSLAGAVEAEPTPPHHERVPTGLEAGSTWRVFASLQDFALLDVTDLPPSGGPYRFFNRAGSDRLTAGAFAGAADRDGDVADDTRTAGAFATLELTAPAGGWPRVDASGGGGGDRVQPVELRLPFRWSAAVWRYHVVLRPGDSSAAAFSIAYAPPSGGSYPASVSFEPASTPRAIEASYAGREVASFESSVPLPLLETPLTRTALKRAGKTVLSDLPNPRRITDAQASNPVADVLIELR